MTKLDLQKAWFGYVDGEFSQPIDEAIKFYLQSDDGQPTSDYWTFEHEGKTYIVTNGEYNNLEIN